MKLKLWFIKLRMKKALVKFYNNNAFQKIRKTFTYTFIKMFVLILAILWLQFLILPHHGYVSIFQPLSIKNPEISCKEVKYVSKPGLLEVYNFAQLEMNVFKAMYIVDGHEYNENILIEIVPKNENSLLYLTYNTNADIYFYSDSGVILYNEYSRGYAQYPGIDNVENMMFSSNNSVNIMFSDCSVNIFSVNKYLYKGTQIASDISRLTCQVGGSISLYDGTFDVELRNSFYGMNFDDIADFKDTLIFFWINEITCDATGKVIFSDSPDKNEYDVQNQSVSFTLNSDKSSASLIRTADDTQLTANGLVYSASIGGYDLFPSFRNWYYNNLYIAPLTLLSVVISSVAVIFKQRNKQ